MTEVTSIGMATSAVMAASSSISSSDHLDHMFELIRLNKVKALVEFFSSLPPPSLARLVNQPHPKYQNTSPLNFAIKCSASHFVLIVLLRLGARCDNSALFLAVNGGLANLFKILLIAGIDVNGLDGEGYSVLHRACFRKNVLMARMILKIPEFTFHNHDRNEKRITPLGVAVEMECFDLVKELCKSRLVDSNVIDSGTHRYLYDLAAERQQFHVCLELESAFRRRDPARYESCKRALKRDFHDLHEYRVEAVVQHQFRSHYFLTFQDDPRGAFEPLDDPTLRLPLLPDHRHWRVVAEDGSIDPKEGWKYSFVTNERGHAMWLNYSGKAFTDGLNSIDNYRCRLLTRIHRR